MAGGGWSDAVDALTARFEGAILALARPSIAAAVRDRWGTPDTPVRGVARTSAAELAGLLLSAAGVEGVTSSARR